MKGRIPKLEPPIIKTLESKAKMRFGFFDEFNQFASLKLDILYCQNQPKEQRALNYFFGQPPSPVPNSVNKKLFS